MSEVRLSAPVKAVPVQSISETRLPGAFKYFGDGHRKHAGLNYTCPCGCVRRGTLEFRTADEHPSWMWDGNVPFPTLHPSVHDKPGGHTHWHGYLHAGYWMQA